jgi:DNA-binding NarL/FixJ family response regulator
MTNVPRLMIVADDAMSASALRRALATSRQFDVIDGYADARGQCKEAAAAYRPDVVVLDQPAGRDTMLARLRELRTTLPDARLVLLPARMDRTWLTEAIAAGADAVIAKACRPETLGALLYEVAAGNVYHAFRPRHAPMRATAVPPLTQRELEILRLVAAGAPNRRIAAKLWITEQTVKFHLSNVYRKLGVANRTEASHYALTCGVVDYEAQAGIAA